MSANIACPKCGGAIPCALASIPGGLSIKMDPDALAKHATTCYSSTTSGLVSILPTAAGFGRALDRDVRRDDFARIDARLRAISRAIKNLGRGVA